MYNNDDIQLTIWDEIATKLDRYNRPAIESELEPRIIAATSVKVKNIKVCTATNLLLLSHFNKFL